MDVFIGPVVHSKIKEKLTILENAAIAVKNGEIKAIEESGDLPRLEKIIGIDYNKISLKKGQFLCPGFIDLHLHAPQYPNIGLGYDKQLLEWLKNYTFPMEMKYNNLKFSEEVYSSIVKATLAHGTTTACYYATIHTESAVKLAETVDKLGQRALVGKVNMNQNSVEGYIEETEESLKKTVDFIQRVQNLNSSLVKPAVTPRFAVSCNMEMMKGLSKIAKTHNTYIQTHISENKGEVDFVKELFPECENYTDVYMKAGLLTPKTILGHGIYLSVEEMKVLAETGSAVAHCPLSNSALQSGVCDVRTLLQSGVNVGLGTDIGGGSHPSILDNLRAALETSIFISFDKTNYTPLNYHEAFYLATLGSAKALRMDNIIGNFEVGKDFDALLIDMDESSDKIGLRPEHKIDDLVQKFIYLGDDRNIKQVLVKGRIVKS